MDTVRLGISVVLSESELAYVALYAVSLVAGRAIFVTLRSSIHGLHIRVDSEYSLAVLKLMFWSFGRECQLSYSLLSELHHDRVTNLLFGW